jgi:hypothetical protein
MRTNSILFASVCCLALQAPFLFTQVQVVPCQLTNPDQDTVRLFPERTNYRTEFMRADEVGAARHLAPKELYRDLEQRLGDSWDPVWETEDIPYVFYEILKGPDRTGWVFGANQGWPGADNAQLMIAVDLEGRIREFYYQKLPSSENSVLQTSQFYAQFIGLTLEQFYVHERLQNLNIQDPEIKALDMIQRIQDPTKTEHEGFQKTLRGLKKILVYLDDFKFHNKIKKEEVFKNVDYVVKNKAKISLLPDNALQQIRQSFQDASRYVVDLVSVENVRASLEERMESPFGDTSIYPVYVVYRDTIYREPFVRGTILGYELALPVDTFKGAVAIGAQEQNMGKILSLEVNHTEFPQFKGLSLVHFYTKDFLTKTHATDVKLDKIGPLVNLKIDSVDKSKQIQKMAKKALILVDEQYFHNYFKKDDIMKKIEEYKGKESA